MKISKEKKQFLKKELREYEKITPMTEDERKALHEWVAAGNSVHENGSMALYEGGRPMDFLDVYREEEDIRRATKGMTYEEETRYLLREYGIHRDPGPMTPDKKAAVMFKVKSEYYQHLCMLYWEVLIANDLRDEAYEYIKEHINEPDPFGASDWVYSEEGGLF